MRKQKMMDTPSRGGAVTNSAEKINHQRVKTVGNVEGLELLRSEIVELRKSFTASKFDSGTKVKDLEDAERLQNENLELRKILDSYKSQFGLLLDPQTIHLTEDVPHLSKDAIDFRVSVEGKSSGVERPEQKLFYSFDEWSFSSPHEVLIQVFS